MARAKKSFSPAYRDEAVKMVIDGSRAIAAVARELGINEGTLGNWVNVYRREHPVAEAPLTLSERARLRELEAENRELRCAMSSWENRRPSSPGSTGELEV